jgi:hypothetical protein
MLEAAAWLPATQQVRHTHDTTTMLQHSSSSAAPLSNAAQQRDSFCRIASRSVITPSSNQQQRSTASRMFNCPATPVCLPAAGAGSSRCWRASVVSTQTWCQSSMMWRTASAVRTKSEHCDRWAGDLGDWSGEGGAAAIVGALTLPFSTGDVITCPSYCNSRSPTHDVPTAKVTNVTGGPAVCLSVWVGGWVGVCVWVGGPPPPPVAGEC